MRTFYILLVMMLCGSFSALAQQTPAVPPPAPAVASDSGAVLLFNGWYLPRYQPRAAASDTTGALLSLFRKRRYAGWLYAVPFMAGAMLALPISSTNSDGQTTVADEAISPPLGVAVLVGTVVGFIMHANKFNKAHLLAVDKAYAAGQPIPAKYRSQLNASHFNEAAYLREALRQQMAREK
ncbi:hypothetical protein [Hymenobacter elongatus]|uniref:Uncharacterized protein n=1 Tax=Hymenobacter elongatus TaxID=877208 RepID=A0A4Z0PFG3_9BACT|nr:hypothetical protein [Hymenobacter elongatus]TGE13857.1 hypothetical protein E5J99_18550 [Hymenobacter elongatus]